MDTFERLISCLERLSVIYKELLVLISIVVVFGKYIEDFIVFLMGVFS